MALTIRPAMQDDLAAILRLERGSPAAAHWTNEQYAQRIATGVVLLAEVDAQSVGFICAQSIAAEWELENIVVSESARRQGIADSLMRELLAIVKTHAGQAVWLEVRESNHAARSLYEKHGFQERGRRSGYYRKPREDAVLYEWQALSG